MYILERTMDIMSNLSLQDPVSGRVKNTKKGRHIENDRSNSKLINLTVIEALHLHNQTASVTNALQLRCCKQYDRYVLSSAYVYSPVVHSVP